MNQFAAEVRAHRRRSFKERERRAAAKREQQEEALPGFPKQNGPNEAILLALKNLRGKAPVEARPKSPAPAPAILRRGTIVFDSEKRPPLVHVYKLADGTRVLGRKKMKKLMAQAAR